MSRGNHRHGTVPRRVTLGQDSGISSNLLHCLVLTPVAFANIVCSPISNYQLTFFLMTDHESEEGMDPHLPLSRGPPGILLPP